MAIYSGSQTSIGNPYEFFAYRNAALSASSNTEVVLDTKTGTGFDAGGNFNTGTGRFTAPIAGKYAFQGSLAIQAGGSILIFAVGLSLNNAQLIQGDRGAFADSAQHNLGVAATLNLAANDTVALFFASNNGGTTVFAVGTAPIYTYLSGYLVSNA